MDDKNYDEFGNYIGPDIPEINEGLSDDNDEISSQGMNPPSMTSQSNNINKSDPTGSLFNNLKNESYQVVLHEDKNFYPEADEIYPGVDNLVMEEDTQPITEPIIPTVGVKTFDLYEKKIPNTSFTFDFLAHLSTVPSLIRNIAVAGSLHHGKTSLMDIFIQLTHNNNELELFKEVRYLDIREDEQKRNISIKANPISLVLPNSKGKSFLFNFIDTPGHSNFIDEVSSAFRMCDGVLIVVDVVEGITTQTEKIIKNAIEENLDMILVLNKIDRLILELKIPPNDGYLKIKNIIDDFNQVVCQYQHLNMEKKDNFVYPTKNNIIFASTLYGIFFTLESYAKKYYEVYQRDNSQLLFRDYQKLSKMLYGEIFYDKEKKNFSKINSGQSCIRSFVHFILEPIYKIIGYSLSEDKEELEQILNQVNIVLKDKDYKMDPKPLLKLICSKFLGHYSVLVDVAVQKVVNSQEGSQIKIKNLYKGNRNTNIYSKLVEAKSNGPLSIIVYKMYHKSDHLSFDAFGRIISGTISKGKTVRILGEHYSLMDKEDQVIQNIDNLWINQSRYKVEINKMQVGNFILLDGIDISMTKNFTIVDNEPTSKDIEQFLPLKFDYSYMKVSVEPLNPSKLPKMNEGLRKIFKSYPACKTKVEESGENIILGTGELYMDSILYDLRHLYTEIELKVSDPVVTFCETVIETSSFKCTGTSHNNKNSLTMIAEPLDKEIISDINSGVLNNIYNFKNTNIEQSFQNYLVQNKGWDKFTAKSVWSFGPDSTNMLIDYTLPTENDKHSLESIRELINQGYEWACREGPLCLEPILNTKFKIISSNISSEQLFKGSGQIIPMARRVCYSSFLTACPRLMEPMLISEILCPIDCIEAINTVLMRRRGHVNSERPLAGTPFYKIKAVLPGLDSFGFETDIRTTTAGQAFCMTWFDNYSVMQGDPLDRSIKLVPLEPSPPPSLAREAMIKTRRRKGLIEDVNICNYLTEEEIEMARNDREYRNYFI